MTELELANRAAAISIYYLNSVLCCCIETPSAAFNIVRHIHCSIGSTVRTSVYAPSGFCPHTMRARTAFVVLLVVATLLGGVSGRKPGNVKRKSRANGGKKSAESGKFKKNNQNNEDEEVNDVDTNLLSRFYTWAASSIRSFNTVMAANTPKDSMYKALR